MNLIQDGGATPSRSDLSGLSAHQLRHTDIRENDVHVNHRQTLFHLRYYSITDQQDNLQEKLHALWQLQRPGLQSLVSPDASAREKGHRKWCTKKRKCGKWVGVRARSANPNRPALPSILLSNVCSLDNKLYYIKLQQTTHHEFKDCCIFTETWLSKRNPEI